MRASRLPLVPVLLLALALGCGSEETGSTSAELASPTFAAINDEVFSAVCTAACHSGGDFAAGGLDMSADPYAALVGVPVTASACVGAGDRVVAGDPEASVLYQKIAAKLDGKDAAPCGDVMPQGPDRPSLSAEDVERIRSWIERGAKDD